MKINKIKLRLKRLALLALAFGGLPAALLAQSSVWISTVSGNWSDTTKWSGGTVADGVGSIADFSTLDITAATTVTLDTSHTNGTLLFADIIPNNNWTLAASGGSILTLNNGLNAPIINVSNQTATFTVPLAGTNGLTKIGGGQLTLSATNSFSGGLVVNSGTILLNTVGSTGTPLIPTTNSITMGGGALNITAPGNTGTTTQTFSNLTVNAGQSSFYNARNANDKLQFTITGTIGRSAGATIDVPGYSSGNDLTTSTSGTVPAGIVLANGVAYFTGGGFSDWDGKTGTTIREGGLNSTIVYTASTSNSLAGNADISSGTNLTTLAANTKITSLRDIRAQLTTIDLGGFTLTNGGTLVSGAVTAGNGLTITNGTLVGPGSGQDVVIIQNGAGAVTVAAAIADNGGASALTKSAGGTLILSGNNTFSGATYLNAGTIQVGNGGTSGGISNSPSVVTRGGLLSFNRSDLVGYSGVISGSGTLTKSGGGRLVLSGDSIYTGATTISAGILQLGAGGAAGSLSNSPSIANSGALVFNLSGPSTYPGSITGNGPITNQGSGSVTLPTSINGLSASLANTGTGSIVLVSTNGYGGSTVISSGSLVLGANASISNSAAITVGAGATLDVSAAGSLSLNSAVGQTLLGSGTVRGSLVIPGDNTSIWGVVKPGGVGTVGTLTINTNLALQGGDLVMDISTSGTDLISVGNNVDFTLGSISASVSGLLTNGLYKLIQWNGTVSAGSVANLALKNFSVAGKVGVLTNSTANELDLLVYTPPSRNLVWTGDGGADSWDNTGSVDWLFGSSPTSFNDFDNVTFDNTAANLLVNINAAVQPVSIAVNSTKNYTFVGTGIAGGILTKSGSSTLTNLTINTGSGQVIIAGGAVQVGNGSTDGDLGSGAISNNAALIFQQIASRSVFGTISGSGTLTQDGATTLTLVGNNTYSGQTTINAGMLQIGSGGFLGTLGTGPVVMNNATTLDFNTASALFVNNGISGNGALSLSGSGVVTLGGANTYLNNTIVANGTLKLGAANVIPNGGVTTGWLVLDGGASAAGTLDLNGNNQTVNALAGLANTVLGQIVNNGSGTGTLTVNQSVLTDYYSTIADNNNAGSGKVAFVMEGTGTNNLRAANTFTGGTTVYGPATLGIGTATSAGTGMITLIGGTMTVLNTPVYMNGYNLTVPAGTNGTFNMSSRVSLPNLYGSGSLTVTVPGTGNRIEVLSACANFSGTLNLVGTAANAQICTYFNGGPFDGALQNAVVNLDNIAVVGNHNSGGNAINFGALNGTTTAVLNGSAYAGPSQYHIGALNQACTFNGTVASTQAGGTAIYKEGTNTFTLTGLCTYSGATTINGGRLVVGVDSYMYNTPSITIAAGAVLDVSAAASAGPVTSLVPQILTGYGSITGAVAMVAGSSLIPGGNGAAGTLTFASPLIINGGVTNNFDLSADPTGKFRANDQITVQADLGMTGENPLVINALNGAPANGVYPLFKFTGNLTNENGVVAAGTLNTNLIVVIPPQIHENFTVSNAVGQVVLIVSGAGNSLVWTANNAATNRWDLTNTVAWTTGGNPTNFFQADTVVFDDTLSAGGATNYTVNLTGTLAPDAITVTSSSNYLFTSSGKISSTAGITLSGTGSLTIANTGGNDYTGVVAVNGGTLKMSVATALGATNGNTVVTGGTLDLNGFAPGAEPVVVQGAGVGGNGAIINNGAQLVNAGFTGNISLAADTTLGGSNRWDVFNGSITGNNHNLGKVGANDIVLNGLGDIGVANINVQSGYFTLIGNTMLGNIGNKLYLWPGGRIDLYNTTVTNTKPVSMTNAIISSSNQTNVFGGSITLNQVETFTAGAPLHLNGVLSGSGSLLANGASILTLNNTETYTGNTTISNGVVALTSTASLASGNLDVAAVGAVLDVSAKTSGLLTLASGQTLKGIGTVRGSVTVPAGAVLSPGEAAVGTLTITNVVTLAGNTVIYVNKSVAQTNSQITATSINVSGALTINNVGPALAVGDSFKPFNGTVSGSFTSIAPATPGAGLAWDTNLWNSLNRIGVKASISTSPFTITSTVVGNSLNLSWPADHQGWEVLIQTNSITKGLSSNWIPVPGSVNGTTWSVPLDPNNGSVFIKMVYPPQ